MWSSMWTRSEPEDEPPGPTLDEVEAAARKKRSAARKLEKEAQDALNRQLLDVGDGEEGAANVSGSSTSTDPEVRADELRKFEEWRQNRVDEHQEVANVDTNAQIYNIFMQLCLSGP